MTNGNADRGMTAEEFDLAASMILLEGAHYRKPLGNLSQQVVSQCSPELVDYFNHISDHKNKGISHVQPVSDSSLSKLCEGFELLYKGEPDKAVSYFLGAFELGLGAKLKYWIPHGLFGIGASYLGMQRFRLARESFLRSIEYGWEFNNHSAIAKGFGGLGNLFMAAKLPHLAFDAYNTDLGFIQTNHYFVPILRVRRSLAYAMTQKRERGLEMLLAETGSFFGEERISAADEVNNYEITAKDEVYRGLAACSVVWNDTETFHLLPEPEKMEGIKPLSVITYHLAATYHHVDDAKNRAEHLRSAKKAFKWLEWNEHPVLWWLDSLLSEVVLPPKVVLRPLPDTDEMSLPELSPSVPELSFLGRFRELKMDDDPWSALGEATSFKEAIKFTLERGLLNISR